MSDEKILKSYKVALMGESGVGKTSIANRFIQKTFDNTVLSTAGVAFFSKIVPIPEIKESCKLDVIIIFFYNYNFKLNRFGIQQVRKDIKV